MHEKISVMNKSFLNDLNSMQLYFSIHISFLFPYLCLGSSVDIIFSNAIHIPYQRYHQVYFHKFFKIHVMLLLAFQS